jgi:hypothetical protein
MTKQRVVVTGIGLLCGVGNTAGEVWDGLLAGKSGMAGITQFDPSEHAVRFATEVMGFDPLNFLDKKTVRKTGSFIHFAVAAAQEALQHRGLVITAENAERIGTQDQLPCRWRLQVRLLPSGAARLGLNNNHAQRSSYSRNRGAFRGTSA